MLKIKKNNLNLIKNASNVCLKAASRSQCQRSQITRREKNKLKMKM
jgi:hypothetical protein